MQMKKNASPLYRTHWAMDEPGYYRVPSKVVSIPVHFVGSERNRTDSATKIQRVLRGFLVRKAMKKITAMRVELERIESEIRVEVLRREERERVRVIETIMNLLLRLDSVRVLHYSGLRECRKSVIRKAVALQEMLDEMALPASEGGKMEAAGNEEEKEGEGDCVVGEDDCLVKEEEGNGMDNLLNHEVVEEEEEEVETLKNEVVEEEVEEKEDGEEENCLMKEEKGDCERQEKDGKKKNLLFEKIVEDNHKMMEMMEQLFQRNEIQTTLLTSLSQRVEQLERAFESERLKRKKKSKAGVKNKQTRPKYGFL